MEKQMLATPKIFTIPTDPSSMEVWLRTAGQSDLSNLRDWKNRHREYFFFKDEITIEQQREWYCAYQLRPEDYMFIVIASESTIGCMGVRLVDDEWDVYNVILGSVDFGGKGLMSMAFQLMLNFAVSRNPKAITLKVLKHNPALGWYKKNGFSVTKEQQEYYCMCLNQVNLN